MSIRIRSAFLYGLLAFGILPMIVLAGLAVNKTVTREFSQIRLHHQTVAKDLAASLTLYEKDLETVILLVANTLQNGSGEIAAQDLMKNLHIDSIAVVSAASGEILSSKLANDNHNLQAVKPTILAEAEKSLRNRQFAYLPVQKDPNERNVIYAVSKSDANLIVSKINTGYFIKLANRVSFGETGRATIVDQAGNVLASPSKEWVDSAKNISNITTVRRLMNGETGVENSYSPAIDSEVIAGFASVAGSNWGVMVSRSLNELYSNALKRIGLLLVGLLGAIFGLIIMFYMAMRWIALPLEAFGRALYEQSITGRTHAISPDENKTSLFELKYIADAYNDLANTIRIQTEQQAKQLLEDHLTGIGNRAYFEKQGRLQIESRIATDKKGVLIFFDIDGFKEINDTRGHKIGDEVLRCFAKNLYPTTKRFMDLNFRGAPAAHPIIARIGGDEFAILLPLPDKVEAIPEICKMLRNSLPKMVSVGGIEIPCNQSAGGAVYPDQGTEIEDLLRRADMALYKAKLNGKNRFEMYSPKGSFGSKNETLVAVTRAIELDEFYLEYQPKFCIKKQKFSSAEALIRWQHPIHGNIAPNMFLPAVEKTYVMKKLGDWVIERSLKDLKNFDKNGHKLQIAINIGAEHFSANDFVENLSKSCERAEVHPSRLQIEVTESVMDVSREIFSSTVTALQKIGFTVAIDDFGRGFSNLTRLASIPVNLIKLDRSLITNAVTDTRVKTILVSAIEMAHALGSSVIVEGVETLEHVTTAQMAGADALQGFYYSKSLKPEHLIIWLEQLSTSPQHRQLNTLQHSLKA